MEFPNVNRFIAGGRLYQRKGIWISYSAKQRMQKGAPLIVLKREFDPDESFAAMVAAMEEQLHTAKFSGGKNTVDGELKLVLMLPGFLRRLVFAAYPLLEAYGMFPKSFIDNDPLYASMFLTDLGSLGLDPVFHHLYEYGNVGTFGVLGRARAEQIPNPDSGRLERKRIATDPMELRRAHRRRPVRGLRHQAGEAAPRGPGEGWHRRRTTRPCWPRSVGPRPPNSADVEQA